MESVTNNTSSERFLESGKKVFNFMGGESYNLNPLHTLMIVCTSMICGESQFYRRKKSEVDSTRENRFLRHFLFPKFYNTDTSDDYFDRVVNDALDYDFEGCIRFVDKLRNEYYMRLNSNYLLVKAIHHPNRVEFNKTRPTLFKTVIENVGCLPTDWTTQYKMLKESGKPIPTIWKRAIASKLQNMSAYHAAKYLHGSKTGNTCASPANLVDLVRITHPRTSDVIQALVKNGRVEVSDDEQTWEKLRSAKKTWTEINTQIRLPHMALLRNLRNILCEYATRKDADQALSDIYILTDRLVNGVSGGKQFPFRYFSAYKAIKSIKSLNESDIDFPLFVKMQGILLEGLNRCVLESVECVPAMKGRVDCLSDNSGSARSGIVSEYGKVNIYEIANLSAILTAYRAKDGGSVWVFGDRLEEYVVSRKPILEQLEEVNALGYTVGGGTETGVWLFWEKFIQSGKRLDTVFIYSDMQAGTGGLYVDHIQTARLVKMGAGIDNGGHIDVLKLVEIYRKTVYSKVNVFSVQVAGYDNSILPDILYRGAILAGWTGKEVVLAYEMRELWDRIENLQRTPMNAY